MGNKKLLTANERHEKCNERLERERKEKKEEDSVNLGPGCQIILKYGSPTQRHSPDLSPMEILTVEIIGKPAIPGKTKRLSK